MWEFLGTSDDPDKGHEWLTDYQKVKDRLVVEVINTDSVDDLPGRPVYTEMQDMSLSFIYKAVIEENNSVTRAALVTDWMLKSYGITQEQLHEDAMESCRKLRPASIMSMGTALAKAAGLPVDSDAIDRDINGLCVVTNANCMRGATALFYPGMIEAVGRMQGGDYYVLPSSIHETLILKDNGMVHNAELEEMVKTINITEVEPKDRLSNQVYHYDSKRRVLERADKFEQRNEAEKIQEQKLKSELSSHYSKPRRHR